MKAFIRMSLCIGALATQSALAQPTFSHPDRIRYDGHCFQIEGKDTFLFSGAFHYFRCPKELWHDRFQKIKDAGFNAVETYVAWNWSEQKKPTGPSDDSQVDLRDLDAWLTMAEDEFGLYTIVRPGPYICSEWASGGFPNWLQAFTPAKTKRTLWYRSDDPVFELWSEHWYREVAYVVGKHQLTKKLPGQKGMILWQVENEYDYAGLPDDAKRNYVHFLIEASKSLGIEVPIFTCWTNAVRFPKGDQVLSQAFDNPNQYNRWGIENVIDALKRQHDAQPWAPKMVTEFQGGWFGGVGNEAALEQDGIDTVQTSSHTLLAIANGLTGLNYYMLFGGTNFGDWAGQGITTSYDYAAPIREWGGTGDKFYAVKAIGGMLQKYGQDLARSEEVPPPTSPDPKVQVYARKGASGAFFVFAWNRDRTQSAYGTLSGGIPFALNPFATGVYRYEGNPQAGEWLIKGDTPGGHGPALSEKGTRLTEATCSRGEAVGWKTVVDGKASTTDLGIWDSRPIFYQFPAGSQGDAYMWLQIGKDGELYLPGWPEGELRQGGLSWRSRGATGVFFNPGWPNGGPGMEKPRGILNARTFRKLPQGKPVTGWKSKRLVDQADRTLISEKLDTKTWDRDAGPSRFPPHSTVIARAVVMLDSDPSSDTVLSTEGVDDIGDFYVNGQHVGHLSEYGVPGTFTVGKALHRGENSIAVVIRNNEGAGGFTGGVALEMPLPESQPLPLKWTTDVTWAPKQSYKLDQTSPIAVNEHPKFSGPRGGGSKALIVKSSVRFPKPGNGPWQILLEAGGDGFLTLNGHPLGRFWEIGPQRGYYLPEPWIQDNNVLEYVAVPGRTGDRITLAELRPLP